METTNPQSESDIAIDEIVELMNKHIEAMRENNPDGVYRLQHVVYNILKKRVE
jgi:hypothetical protein